jgi:hypothetical protein
MSLDVLRARVAFRDRAFLDVMDLALRFVAANARLYAKLAFVALVPGALVTIGVARLWGWSAGWIVAVLLSFIVQLPFTVLASRLVFQKHVSARVVLAAAVREVARVTAMRLAWLVVIALGSTMVLPGLWLGAIFLYVDEIMVLERSPIVAAFGRSQRLATSSMGESFAATAMVLGVPLVAVLMADIGGRALLGELLQLRAPQPVWVEGASVLGLLGWFGVIPYVTTARLFAYLNIRTRAEGWDIQTRFAAIAARAEQDEAS